MPSLDINNVLVIITLGLVATLVAALALSLARWTKLVDSDILSAVGSVFTHQRAKYKPVGWMVHLVVGILFAFLYIAVWNALNIAQPLALIVVATAFGMAHGILVSYFLAIFVGEHHRLRRMRGSAGFGMAVVQWGAHIVYGFVLGVAGVVYLYLRLNA